MQKIEKTWPNPEKWAIIWVPNDGGQLISAVAGLWNG
jgi:hypothetical protein